MGKALADTFPEARAVFDEADTALGESLSGICFEGPDDRLTLTENTQPAILAMSTAAMRVLAARGIEPSFVAGHSLGEYSANVAAGTMVFAEAVQVVRRRGRYMQEAVPAGEGAMAAIIGADLRTVEDACEEASGGGTCSPANINSPGQIVIAGKAAAVDRAIEILKRRGVKRAVRLNVSAPFHCALMMPAQERLAADLEEIEFANLGVPLVSNVDAAVTRSGAEARAKLVRQVSQPVRWQESVERLAGECGVGTFVEVGPGKVLSGLIRKTADRARCLGVEDGAGLRATRAALGEDPQASERAAVGE
jgi:[acyl-carrier-protein] S-malonyltransferase